LAATLQQLLLLPSVGAYYCYCCLSLLPATAAWRRLLLPCPAHCLPEPLPTHFPVRPHADFAYGSNINKKVFEGRRMIKPAESLPAVLPGWRLEFSQPGLPYSEPAFAAVDRQPEAGSNSSGNGSGSSNGSSGAWPDVHGVLHRITPSQFRYVLETEGASEQSSEDSGYAVVEAKAVTYNGQEVVAKTLTVPAKLKARMMVRVAGLCVEVLRGEGRSRSARQPHHCQAPACPVALCTI